ncbi:MAG: DsbA family protein [Nanoarchaeota archaeon]
MSEENKESITIKKETLWKYSTFILAALLIIGAFMVFNNGSPTGSVITGQTVAPGTVAVPSGPVKITIDSDDPILGNADAKVTVIKFSDFSCPFCAAASGDNEEMVSYMKQRNPSWEPIVTNFIKDYVDTGKARFVMKYAMGHSGGRSAQLVAWCLNDQKLYWKFHAKAFANIDDVEDLDKMKNLAKEVGADLTKLQSCLDSKKYDSKFNKHEQQGSAAGVEGTPAFFVNGKILSGAQPYSTFKQAVEAELAAA